MRKFILLVLLVPSLAAAEDCRYSAQRDFDADAAGLRNVAFALGSSDVVVEGVRGLDKIEVRGRACASDQAWLADFDVRQQRSGDRLTITAVEPERRGFHSGYSGLTVRVRMPQTLAVAIHAGSGDADVRDVAALDVDAGSGDLGADHVAGAVSIELGSGDFKGSDLGSVDIRQMASGDVQIRDVRGDLKIGHAASGDLRVNGVAGAVQIGSVGSGDVSISRVDRDVSIDSVGSGDVVVDEVGGNFTVRSSGSGDVRHHGVRGSVSVPRERD